MKGKFNISVIISIAAVCIALIAGVVIGRNTQSVNDNGANTTNYEENSTTTTTTSTQTTTTTTTSTTTTAAIPMSEWGFNNSNDWGNKLVKIVGNPDNKMDQSYKNFNDEYVIISEGSAYWDFYPSTNQFVQGSFYFDNKQVSMSSTYVVVSNDLISAPSLGGAFNIDERIVVGDIVIFRRGWEYYIPYEMLDIERGPEFYKEDGILDDYKVYLK